MDKMMGMRLDISGVKPFLTEGERKKALNRAFNAKERLLSRAFPGSEFTGWLDLPSNYDRDEFKRILECAKRIKEHNDILVVIGIGGSYLGAKAAVEYLGIGKEKNEDGVELIFAGNCLSASYLKGVLEKLEGRDWSICVISKSGTTTEPAVSFRVLGAALRAKYGAKTNERIVCITDSNKGVLKEIADSEGYETFRVPDDIGGRYSVLSPVGLLPIAAAGGDIACLMEGAKKMMDEAIGNHKDTLPLIYASLRELLYEKGKKIELTASFEPALHYMGEWIKQLFGESLGKEQRGMFPASVDFSTDLHSMGQYIQEGERILAETFISIDKPLTDIDISDSNIDDGLNFLKGRSMEYVNNKALEGTILAHIAGGVPVIRLCIEDRKEQSLGALFYFYEFTAAINGLMMGINPFNQPGVEEYKKNMFRLLGKPGY